MKKYNLGLISTNRNTIYGLSILWIMLFHSSIVFSSPLITSIKNLGKYGVDIFLFVSGISLYFSFEKSNNLKAFYIKRLKRVVIPTLLIVIPYYALYFVLYYHYFKLDFYFSIITGLDLFVTGGRGIWFITAILLCYLAYPFLHKLFRQNNSVLALVILLTICVLVNYTISRLFPAFWQNSEILFYRFPVFIIGAFAGKYVFEDKTLPFNRIFIAIGSIAIMLGYIFANQFIKDIFSIRYVIIPCAICATIIFSVLGSFRPINKLMSFISPITLEIYLCHERILFVLSKAFPNWNILVINGIAFCLALIAAQLLAFISEAIRSHISHKII